MNSNFPKGKRRKIRDLVLARLQAPGSPIARAFRTWQLYTGKKDETQEWTVAMLPALRAEWSSGAMHWSAQNQHRGDLTLSITIGVPGTDQGDLMDAWEAVEKVLMPPEDAINPLLAATQDHGVFSLAFESAGITTGEMAAGGLGMTATGKLVVRLNLNT
jgi:hypothetical protein